MMWSNSYEYKFIEAFFFFDMLSLMAFSYPPSSDRASSLSCESPSGRLFGAAHPSEF
jgi:hypothetical protein